jgi:hypothetical protein
MLVVLRLQSDTVNFQSYLTAGSLEATVWKQGDLTAAGRVRTVGGANPVLSHELDPLGTAFARLYSMQDLVRQTIAQGGNATVGTSTAVELREARSRWPSGQKYLGKTPLTQQRTVTSSAASKVNSCCMFGALGGLKPRMQSRAVTNQLRPLGQH